MALGVNDVLSHDKNVNFVETKCRLVLQSAIGDGLRSIQLLQGKQKYPTSFKTALLSAVYVIPILHNRCSWRLNDCYSTTHSLCVCVCVCVCVCMCVCVCWNVFDAGVMDSSVLLSY